MNDERRERYNIITGDEAKEKIIDMLKSTEIGRLALFDEKYPYIIPMNHVYYDGTLILHGSFTGKKIDLIKLNGNAGYEIDYPVKELKVNKKLVKTCHLEYESVVLSGEILEIEDSAKRHELLSIVTAEYGLPFQHGNEARCNAMVFHIHSASARTGRFLPKAPAQKLYLYDFKTDNKI